MILFLFFCCFLEQNNHQQQQPSQQQQQQTQQQQQQQPQSGDEDTSWAKFSDQSGGEQPELKHSVSIPGSEGSVSGDEDVWQINTEQRTYYTNQFQRLQPEPCGLLGGKISAEHFIHYYHSLLYTC